MERNDINSIIFFSTINIIHNLGTGAGGGGGGGGVQGNKQTTRLMQAFLNTCSDFYMEKKIELIIENKSLLPFFEALHLSSNDFLAKDKPNLCKLNVQLKR